MQRCYKGQSEATVKDLTVLKQTEKKRNGDGLFGFAFLEPAFLRICCLEKQS
jgi:hypothetical protein